MLQKIQLSEMSPDHIDACKPEGGFRLITRSDMDGLVSAVLLKELGLVDEVEFVHPKDMQDGKIEVTDRDITTNLPYVPGVFVAFDHHDSEIKRLGNIHASHVMCLCQCREGFDFRIDSGTATEGMP